MKTVVIAAAVALLAGIFVGGLGPRGEVRRLQGELAEAKEASERPGGAASMLSLSLALSGRAAARADLRAG